MKLPEDEKLNNLIGNCKDENDNLITREFLFQVLENDGNIICKYEKDGLKYFNVDLQLVDGYVVMNLSDITHYKLEEANIKEIAMIDELTGLYNRKKLDAIQEDILNKQLCLVMFDIDDFKQINDTYGHLKGDEVLKELAKVIQFNLRDSDIIIRWGGEEFLIIIDNLLNINKAEHLAEKLREKVNQIEIDEVGHFSCSFGVSCGLVKKIEDLDIILNQTDEALYRAKETGKNKVVSFYNL